MPPEAQPLVGAVIAFDLDGTLVDSAPDLVATLNHILAEEGITPLPFPTGNVIKDIRAGLDHHRQRGAKTWPGCDRLPFPPLPPSDELKGFRIRLALVDPVFFESRFRFSKI